MAYIGRQSGKIGQYIRCNTITPDGSTTTFALTNVTDSTAVFPGSDNNVLCSLSGVMQAPGSGNAFTISNSNIVFASAPDAADVVDFVIVLGDTISIGTPTDGTITNSKLSSNFSGPSTGFKGISHRSPDSTVTETFTVKVVTKTSEHYTYDPGASGHDVHGYSIDDREAPYLQLAPGVYKFDQADSTNSGHPLLLYYDSTRNVLMSTGVVAAGTPGSAGASTTITVDDNTPTPLFYQCSAHALMGHKIDFIGGKRTGLNITKTTATGDASTVAFTITNNRTVDNVLVFVNGICLTPTDDYTISGTTLTFVTAPAASAEITVRYLG
jgi:hypothetical protein